MSKKTKANHAAGIGCTMLFLLPFASVGVGTIGMVGWTIANWIKVMGWKEGQATILEVKVNHASDSDGSATSATFEYKWDGETYTSERASLYGISDNFGSYQHDLARKLKKHQKSGEPVECYINPKKPKQAILDRTLRWEFITFFTVFAECFGMVGLGGLAALFFGRKDIRDEAELELLHPEEPWKWNRGWLEGMVEPNGGNDARIPILVTFYWNMVCLPLWIICPWKIFTGHPWALVGMIIPAIGILIAIFAVRSVIRCNKYGGSLFHMVHTPGVIGGTLEGAILVDKSFYPDEGIDLRLLCEERISRHKDSDDITVLYEDSQTLEAANLGDIDGKMAVPVFFQIPYDSEQTDEKGRRTVTWSLMAKASVPGVDYKANFDVPVYMTEASQEQADDLQTLLSESVDQAAPLKKADIHVDYADDGTTHIKVTPFRNLGAAFGLGFFASIWISVSLVIFFVQAAWPMFLVSLTGVFAIWGALDIFFQSAKIQAHPQGFEFERGWAFMRRKFHFTPDEIKGFDLPSTMQSGRKHYYKLVVELHSGKKVAVVRYIRGAKAGRRLIAVLEAALWQ